MARPRRAERLLPVLLAAVACGLPPPPLEVEYDGCLSVEVDDDDGFVTCVLDRDATELRLWARSDPGVPITVETGGPRLRSADAEPVQGGYLFRLRDLGPPTPVVHAGTGWARSWWTIGLTRRERPLYFAEGREALEARLDAGVDRGELGYVLEALASRHRRDGDFRAAAERFADAARAYDDAGQVSRRLSALTRRHFVLYSSLEALEAAGETLAELPRPPPGDARSTFLAAFYRGAWANRVGRFRTALRELETAGRQAERLAMPMRIYPELERVHLLSRLGRYDEARRLGVWLRAEADRRADQPRLVADALNSVGWSELLMVEAGREGDPVAVLERALAAARQLGDRELLLNVETNLALARLAAGRPDAARAHLARVRELAPDPPWWLRVWSLDVAARLALAEGDAATSLALYRRLGEGPEAAFSADARWRADVGRGAALETLGRQRAALAAYARAEDRVERASLAVPLDEGRQSSVHRYRRGTARHLDLLLREGRIADALALARRARTRTLRGLLIDARLDELDAGERARWHALIARYRALQTRIRTALADAETASAARAEALRATRAALERERAAIFDDALALLDAGGLGARAGRPPRAGELLLVYHPVADGWVGFAAGARGVEAARLGALTLADEAALGARLLGPFAAAIARAETIRILPYGALWGVDFHALPWRGAPLLERAPVVYGLDLPPRPGDAEPARDALLVADPTRSLARAPSEVADVARRLERARPGWRVRRLEPAAATLAAVRAGLDAGGALFHFAGHGDLVGWSGDSGLVLAEGFEGRVNLTIRDVLTLERAPATVVLSGCDTVRPASPEAPASLGIGHAFLLAGGRWAVGVIERVDDRDAEALIRRFYDAWRGPGSEAAALRAAQLELRRRGMTEWASFRVLER